MYFYCILVIFVGIIAGIIIAVCSKKEDGLVYGVLDKVGIVTNIFLIPAYAIASIFCVFLVMLSYFPEGEGILGILSWVVAFTGASGPALCGVGLGASVALRRKGKSRLSFWAQFAGVVGVAITILFLIMFGDILFGSLN